MKLKVCGMKYLNNMEAVAKLQPNYLGFIFYDKSPRKIESTIEATPESIQRVGVFVNALEDEIIEKITAHKLNVVQLHGDESPTYCKRIATTGVQVIKVFSIKNAFDFSVLEPYESVCDFFLFDTKGRLPGGNGYAFNWEVLAEYPSTKPFFLSGGIGLDEIETIKKFQSSDAAKYCYAIDVNSKFEIEPGLKNLDKLKQFISEL